MNHGDRAHDHGSHVFPTRAKLFECQVTFIGFISNEVIKISNEWKTKLPSSARFASQSTIMNFVTANQTEIEDGDFRIFSLEKYGKN